MGLVWGVLLPSWLLWGRLVGSRNTTDGGGLLQGSPGALPRPIACGHQALPNWPRHPLLLTPSPALHAPGVTRLLPAPPTCRNSVRLVIRKVQYAPEKPGPQPTAETTRHFLMSDRSLHLEASLDKEVSGRGGVGCAGMQPALAETRELAEEKTLQAMVTPWESCAGACKGLLWGSPQANLQGGTRLLLKPVQGARLHPLANYVNTVWVSPLV